MTELANYETQAPAQAQGLTLEHKIEYAKTMAQSGLLPKEYRNQPANILLSMEMGEAMGIPTIQAINEVHVIEGRPSASADLIGGMVRKAGHILRVRGDMESATAQVIRRDDPDFTFEVTWDLERAKQAGLYPGKPSSNWSKYPAAMLKARAITEVARSACPESLYGVSHTSEELGAVVDAEGRPVQPAHNVPVSPNMTSEGSGSRISQARAQQAQRQPQQEPQADAISQDQWARINQALSDAGFSDAASQPQAITDILGRTIARPTDIKAAEFDTIMAALNEGVVDEVDEQVEAQEAIGEFVNE